MGYNMAEIITVEVNEEFKKAIKRFIDRKNAKNKHLAPLTESILIRASVYSVIFRRPRLKLAGPEKNITK